MNKPLLSRRDIKDALTPEHDMDSWTAFAKREWMIENIIKLIKDQYDIIYDG